MKKSDGLRKVLVGLAVVRGLLSVLALLLAKFLYEDHFLWLVLMRPTKEVMLAGAFLAKRQNNPGLIFQIAVAALPLLILGVWQFYYLGRFTSKEIEKGKLPGLAGRILPKEKFDKIKRVLKKKGPKVVFLGRLAAFPSTLLAAAAGASDMRMRKFLPADMLGAAAAMVEVMSVGYLLGGLFKPDDPKTSWLITGAGVAALFGLLWTMGKYLARE